MCCGAGTLDVAELRRQVEAVVEHDGQAGQRGRDLENLLHRAVVADVAVHHDTEVSTRSPQPLDARRGDGAVRVWVATHPTDASCVRAPVCVCESVCESVSE